MSAILFSCNDVDPAVDTPTPDVTVVSMTGNPVPPVADWEGADTLPPSAGAVAATLAAGRSASVDIEQIHLLPLDQILPSPWGARAYDCPEAIEGLVASIRACGVIHPIVVRRLDLHAETGAPQYQVVVGHRRVEAARRLAGEPDSALVISAIIKDLDDLDARLMRFAEDRQRQDRPALWEARECVEIQNLLASGGRPHTVRAMEPLLGVRWGKISEDLKIGSAVTDELLREAGACGDDGTLDLAPVYRVSRAALLEVAKAPEADRVRLLTAAIDAVRHKPVRATRKRASADAPDTAQAAAPVVEGAEGDTSNAAQAAVAGRFTADGLRERGRFNITLRRPFKQYGAPEAERFLQDLLPAVAVLGERTVGAKPLVQDFGTGVVVYLKRTTPAGSPRRVREARRRAIGKVTERLTALLLEDDPGAEKSAHAADSSAEANA